MMHSFVNVDAPRTIVVLYLGGIADGRAETAQITEGKPLPELVNVAKPGFQDAVKPSEKWEYDTYRLGRFIVGDYEVSAYVFTKVTMEQARARLLNLLAAPVGRWIQKPVQPA